jgi:hypothetical protein
LLLNIYQILPPLTNSSSMGERASDEDLTWHIWGVFWGN